MALASEEASTLLRTSRPLAESLATYVNDGIVARLFAYQFSLNKTASFRESSYSANFLKNEKKGVELKRSSFRVTRFPQNPRRRSIAASVRSRGLGYSNPRLGHCPDGTLSAAR